MCPSSKATQETLEMRQKAFVNSVGTNHWPHEFFPTDYMPSSKKVLFPFICGAIAHTCHPCPLFFLQKQEQENGWRDSQEEGVRTGYEGWRVASKLWAYRWDGLTGVN
jgi:hypothetical protein